MVSGFFCSYCIILEFFYFDNIVANGYPFIIFTVLTYFIVRQIDNSLNPLTVAISNLHIEFNLIIFTFVLGWPKQLKRKILLFEKFELLY